MATRTVRQLHAFDVVLGREAFLRGVPSVVATAVQKARDLAPNHPPFAIGVMAHYIAHHDLALMSDDGFYQEDHLFNQCRGAFVIPGAGKRFGCFLVSGQRTDDGTFKVHRKGPMTVGSPPEQGVLFALEEDADAKGNCFFLVVHGFTDARGHELRGIHLVWGRLADRTTLAAERAHLVGEIDLGSPVRFAPRAGLPPIEDVTPLIEIEDE